MVRGRRVRAVVACSRNDDCCSPNPKRKDQKNMLNGKLAHSILSPKNKTNTITDFFQAVDLDDAKSELKLGFRKSPSTSHITNDSANFIQHNLNEEIPKTPIITNGDKSKSKDSPATPHRIELCTEPLDEDKKNDATVKTHTEIPKSQPPTYKSRRKLNNHQEFNKQSIGSNTNADRDSNHKLTEYFPVRRSVRKTKKTVLEEKQKSLEQLLRNNIEDGLKVKNFEGKGRGVIAAKEFNRGDFVVEYSGDLIDMVEAKEREEKYAQDQNTGCYMYYFKHNGQQYCIDATIENGRLGRLVNHSRNGNLITRIVMMDNKPRLVLIARDDIKIGEEVLYDYGDRSKESLKHHPWLAY